jgi:hypothetical protein
MNAEKPKSVVPEAVRQLLEQRSTYREWLSRLDEVGEKYRREVAERVRADYQTRLDEVAVELEEHRHELVSTLDLRRTRLDELSAATERRSVELEEAELRFQVGELDDATWEERRSELAEGLEEIESELAVARAAVEALETVLRELTTDGVTDVLDRAGVAWVAAPDHSEEHTAVADAADEEPSGDEAGAHEAPEVREVESAVLTQEAEPDTAVPESEQSGAVEDAESESEDYLDELEFLESLSLDDPDSFDAVSRMLEDEEDR